MDSVFVRAYRSHVTLAAVGGIGNGWTNRDVNNVWLPIEGPRPGALKISKRHCCVESEYESHNFECVSRRHRERYTFFQKKDNRIQVRNAASNQPFETESGALSSKNYGDSVRSFLDAFYRFSRPHTVIGTALSIVSVSLLAVEKLSDLSPLFLTGVLEAIVAALFMNIYIVGLNQLFDIEIDKINKPYLPLASGEYSFGTGVAIVSTFSIMVSTRFCIIYQSYFVMDHSSCCIDNKYFHIWFEDEHFFVEDMALPFLSLFITLFG